MIVLSLHKHTNYMPADKNKLVLEMANKFAKPYIYVGVSEDWDDLNNRRYSHEREGYMGVMYYRNTNNMRKSEDYQIKHARKKGYQLRNIQQKSNVSQVGGAKVGYIYVISK